MGIIPPTCRLAYWPGAYNCLYFHIDPNECFLACGMWRPPADALAAIRTRIAEHPDIWLAARDNKAFGKVWGGLSGEGALKRPPRGFDPSHPCIEDIKRKDFLGVIDLPRADALSPKLPARAAKAFAAATPLMKFLCDAMNLPY